MFLISLSQIFAFERNSESSTDQQKLNVVITRLQTTFDKCNVQRHNLDQEITRLENKLYSLDEEINLRRYSFKLKDSAINWSKDCKQKNITFEAIKKDVDEITKELAEKSLDIKNQENAIIEAQKNKKSEESCFQTLLLKKDLVSSEEEKNMENLIQSKNNEIDSIQDHINNLEEKLKKSIEVLKKKETSKQIKEIVLKFDIFDNAIAKLKKENEKDLKLLKDDFEKFKLLDSEITKKKKESKELKENNDKLLQQLNENKSRLKKFFKSMTLKVRFNK